MLSTPFTLGRAAGMAIVIAATAMLAAAPADAGPKKHVGPNKPFELQILHINDHHSHLQPDSGVDLTLDGQTTRVVLGGFPSIVAKMTELAKGKESYTLRLHAGDALTGTLYYTLFLGEADAKLMNTACFDALELGNHEFDGGDAELADFLDFLNDPDDNCPKTAVLAANVIPEVSTPLRENISKKAQLIHPYTIKVVKGHRVGIIGLEVGDATKYSSSPLDTDKFLDEVETAKKYIAKLQKKGVDVIVLLTHVGYNTDLEKLAVLDGVDVVVGGHSHTLLGDADTFASVGLQSGGEYPTVVTQTDHGDRKACVVQAWSYAYAVGELHVSFDKNGEVVRCEGNPHLLLADSFKRDPDGNGRVEITGADRDAVYAQIAETPELDIVTPDPYAQAALDDYAAEVEVLAQEVIGTVTEKLCLSRIPGSANGTCEDADVSHGGDPQQLVAKAFQTRSFEADIALQNSGGVRIDLNPGDLTIGTAYELLPFANTMLNLEMSGAEIKTALEQGIENALCGLPTSYIPSTGAFPYAAGLRWDVDLTTPNGSRLSNIQVQDPDGTWRPLTDDETHTVVVNSFMATGGDGYFILEDLADRQTDTYIDYAQGFIDFVEEDLGGVVSKLPYDEYSTQNVSYGPYNCPTSD